jgi:hypothetical protein
MLGPSTQICLVCWCAECDLGILVLQGHPQSSVHTLIFFGGEVVTSRYFHRKAVLSTLDQLGKTKTHTHTQGNLQNTRHTRPSSKKKFFLFFFVFLVFISKHTDMATATHIG